MAETRSEIQVGVALVAALLILVFGLMWFEDRQINANYQPVLVRYETVGGLGVGDPVNVRGIKMGQVREITLREADVLVELRVLAELGVNVDSEIRIGSAGIMGERMVAIIPGGGAPAPEGHVFDGHYEAATTDLVGQVEEFNVAVMGFLTRADSLLQDLRRDDTLVRAVTGAAEATESLNEVLSENRQDLRMVASNTAQLTARLDRFFEERGDDLEKGAEGMARAAESLDSLATQLSSVLDDTQHVLSALKNQEGPAGRMIYDQEAGENLVQTLEKLRFLVEDIQRNPERYLTVKVF
jgi:phospholipid/cholesterol/gamma-HCH transport system substrate-binding protein